MVRASTGTLKKKEQIDFDELNVQVNGAKLYGVCNRIVPVGNMMDLTIQMVAN